MTARASRSPVSGTTGAKALGRRLLAWFARARRDLPWREGRGDSSVRPPIGGTARPDGGVSFKARGDSSIRPPIGGTARRDPYRVWLSEIMLQQTTVATAAPYYERFVASFPTVEALARASLDDVLHAWQGLGYYARARNLHRAAREVVESLGGRFPGDEAGLARLPGVGPYTAAAVAAIAFGRKTVPIDGNVARVIARLHGLRTRLPEGRAALLARARAMLPGRTPGDFAEALMDLGATVCTPKKPRCGECPWRSACRARALGDPAAFPPKKKKAARPVRHAVLFWAEDGLGRVLVRRRPERGLLGGMMEFPSTPWREKPWAEADALRHAPAKGAWRLIEDQTFSHVFSHFALEGRVARAQIGGRARDGFRWWPLKDLDQLALPSVMRKAAEVAGIGATGRKRPANRTAPKASNGR
jgi:A/G-specific adenine glycosylase